MNDRFADFLPQPKPYLSLPPAPLSSAPDVYYDYLQKLEKLIEKNFAIYQNNAAVKLTDEGKFNLRFRRLFKKEQKALLQAESRYFVISRGHFYQTQRQRKVDRFNLLLPYLQRLTFTEQSAMLVKSYLYVFQNSGKVIGLVKKGAHDEQQIAVFDKEQFLRNLAALQIGGWRLEYKLPKNIVVYDGSRWHLSFAFVKGKTVRQQDFKGYLAWPYNFADLKRLLKISD